MDTDLKHRQLWAGAGCADITPAQGIQLAGDIGRYRPVEEIRDPLYAKALVFQSQQKRACILSLDVTGVMRRWSDKLRRQVAKMLDTEPEAVVVHSMQSHSAPMVGNHMISEDCTLVGPDLPWLRGGDDRYIAPFFEGVTEAVRQAKQPLSPVAIKAGRSMDGRTAYNRRFVMRDGKVKTHPITCDPEILHCEGPTDPEVGIAAFTGSSGRQIAALLHHTCHPCHGYPQRWVSPDWPRAWSNRMAELIGDECVPLVLNGACGNIHHHNHLDPNQEDTIEGMAHKLTETSEWILNTLEPLGGCPLEWRSRTLQIPLRKLTVEELSSAKRIIEEHPTPIWLDAEKTSIDWKWVYAATTLDLAAHQRKQETYAYEIQAIRIGDIAIVAWPGEPFVEAQLAVKKDSPAAYTLVAHFCSDSAGYLPTREAFELGGYETHTSNWSKLDPSALGLVVEKTKELLHQLFRY